MAHDSEFLTSLKARYKTALEFELNQDMMIEAILLGKQIEALETKKKKTEDFLKLVEDFEACVRDDAWKGGGHPADMPGITKAYEESKKTLLDYEKDK